MSERRVVVTGMGLASCFGTDADRFYQNLLDGESGVGPITYFPCDEYPTRFASSVRDFATDGYIDGKQGRRIDPFLRYTLVAGKKAMEHAHLSPEKIAGWDMSKCGIVVGSGMGGLSVFFDANRTFFEKGFARVTPFLIPYIITNMGGALLAIDLGFTGPNYSISAACATANYCIISAAHHIERGDADLMLCGGAEAPITPIGLAGFVAIHALSRRNEECKRASRPWDKGRDGFVLGEGAALLVLEELEHAKGRGAPILAEYLGGAVSTDAYHITQPRQDGLGVARVMEMAMRDAGISPTDVNYINAHATSTLLGDLCEIRAIRAVFGAHAKNIKINATKSMIGHCMGASAGMEAIAAIQAIRRSILHPTINLDDPEEELGELDVVSGSAQEHRVEVALSNAFGFGGHNSSVLFAPYRA